MAVMVYFVCDRVDLMGVWEMAVMAEQASKLLDFNQKLDIPLLDNVVTSMYTAEGEQVIDILISIKL